MPLQQKTALTEPPEMKMLRVLARSGDVGEESVVLEGRFNHMASDTKFFSHLFHAGHHISQFLFRRPARGLAQAAVRRKR